MFSGTINYICKSCITFYVFQCKAYFVGLYSFNMIYLLSAFEIWSREDQGGGAELSRLGGGGENYQDFLKWDLFLGYSLIVIK